VNHAGTTRLGKLKNAKKILGSRSRGNHKKKVTEHKNGPCRSRGEGVRENHLFQGPQKKNSGRKKSSGRLHGDAPGNLVRGWVTRRSYQTPWRRTNLKIQKMPKKSGKTRRSAGSNHQKVFHGKGTVSVRHKRRSPTAKNETQIHGARLL